MRSARLLLRKFTAASAMGMQGKSSFYTKPSEEELSNIRQKQAQQLAAREQSIQQSYLRSHGHIQKSMELKGHSGLEFLKSFFAAIKENMAAPQPEEEPKSTKTAQEKKNMKKKAENGIALWLLLKGYFRMFHSRFVAPMRLERYSPNWFKKLNGKISKLSVPALLLSGLALWSWTPLWSVTVTTIANIPKKIWMRFWLISSGLWDPAHGGRHPWGEEYEKELGGKPFWLRDR